MLTPWNKDRILVDPFCGSGTFPIEAAMMAADMAPGHEPFTFWPRSWEHLIPRGMLVGCKMKKHRERDKS